MDERIARLRAHEQNIDRYQRLLRTKLTDLESQFLEKRLSEERLSSLLAPASPQIRKRICGLDF